MGEDRRALRLPGVSAEGGIGASHGLRGPCAEARRRQGGLPQALRGVPDARAGPGVLLQQRLRAGHRGGWVAVAAGGGGVGRRRTPVGRP